MSYSPTDYSRSIGYIYHDMLGIIKSIWYIAPLIVCIGSINGWFAPGNLLLWFSGVDAAVDIVGLLMTLLWLGPSHTTMPSGQATWVSKWSLLKHTLSDQWHFSYSLVTNAWFILGFYSFFFANAPIGAATLARFIGYHFLYLALTLSKAIIIFFTGFTDITCDECGPKTVKPCVECDPEVSVETGNENATDSPSVQVPMSAMPNNPRSGARLFIGRKQ